MSMASIGPYVGVVLTLGVLTFVLKENAFFRFIEYTFIGVSCGYGTILGAKSILDRSWSPLVKSADYIQIVVLVLGLLYLTRISERYGFISRWPAAIVTGVGLGVTIKGIMDSDIVEQTISTITVIQDSPSILTSISGFLLMVFVSSAVFYYVFTFELKPPYDSVARLGRLVYMGTFGAAIAFEIQGRTAGLIARFVEMLITLGII